MESEEAGINVVRKDDGKRQGEQARQQASIQEELEGLEDVARSSEGETGIPQKETGVGSHGMATNRLGVAFEIIRAAFVLVGAVVAVLQSEEAGIYLVRE